MQNYRRVTYADRCHISAFLQAGNTIQEISHRLGFDKSTIHREIKRNGNQPGYNAKCAEQAYLERFKRCRRKHIITRSIDTVFRVYLDYGWSPEQTAQRFTEEKILRISHQTIYRKYRWDANVHRLFRKRKKGGGRHTQRQNRLQTRQTIHQHPSIVKQRVRRGDWERDGMYGANRKQLLVLTDRKSRYTKLRKIGTGISKDVTQATTDTLKSLGKRVYTITNDNGTEFNDHASLPYRTYFCDPNKPQQRGTVENTIGLLRQYIKRNTDLDSLTDQDLIELERRINFRPRKCLDYKTPFEVFFKKKVALAMLS
jgi:IS30 family transposase